MRTFSETGHYKNVANFNTLKTFAQGLGAQYTPQKEVLKLPNLVALLETATTLHNDVKEQSNKVALAIDQRQLIFENIKPLATRIINTMGATDVSQKTIEDAKTINAKIQGARIKKKSETVEGNEEAKIASVSRQSYDSFYENFKSLNNLLQQDGNYNPEETDVNTTGLTTKENEMLEANKNVTLQNNDLANKRIARNKTFYIGESSLIKVARGVKKYIRGKYGVTSPEFAQIRSILFKDLSIS
jgi:hypothetical protein